MDKFMTNLYVPILRLLKNFMHKFMYVCTSMYIHFTNLKGKMLINSHICSTTWYKLDTRVQQTRECLTNFAEALTSGLCAECMARKYAL